VDRRDLFSQRARNPGATIFNDLITNLQSRSAGGRVLVNPIDDHGRHAQLLA
jgi:hypothetical protein